jgi:hypothetical protein
MKVLRALLLLVLLAGSASSPAAHALRMPVADAAVAAPSTPPPCHQDAGRTAAADPAPSHHHDDAGAGDCCPTGHCDCVHASPAALVLPAMPGPPMPRGEPPRLLIDGVVGGSADAPLRPPAA